MEQVVEFIRNLAKDRTNWSKLINGLKENMNILISEANNLTQNGKSTVLLDAIASLGESSFSFVNIQLLWIQYTKGKLNREQAITFIDIAIRCLKLTKKFHATYATSSTFQLSSIIAKIAIDLNQPGKVIHCLVQLYTEMMHDRSNCLTPLHYLIIQLCCFSQQYAFATKFLDANPIYEIDIAIFPISHDEFYQYFYYSGLCCLENNQLQKAIFYFEQILLTPAEKINDLLILVLKKLKLISLIEYGKSYEIPSGVSNNVRSHVKELIEAREEHFKHSDIPSAAKANFKVYEDLVTLFDSKLSPKLVFPLTTVNQEKVGTSAITCSTHSPMEISFNADKASSTSENLSLENYVAIHGELMKMEGNLDLAGKVVDALLIHAILALPNTYSCIPFADLVTILLPYIPVGIEDKLSHILNVCQSLVTSKKLHLKLHNQTVVFPSGEENSHYTTKQYKQIQVLLEQNMQFSQKLVQYKKEIGTSVNYIVNHNKKHNQGVYGGHSIAHDMDEFMDI